MKVIIAGSRTIKDPLLIPLAIEKSGFKVTEIVTGMARGVDTLAFFYGVRENIPRTPFPAKWIEYGRKAGLVRNEEMAKYADALIAIWDGKSVGAQHMIETMAGMEKPLFVMEVDGND